MFATRERDKASVTLLNDMSAPDAFSVGFCISCGNLPRLTQGFIPIPHIFGCLGGDSSLHKMRQGGGGEGEGHFLHVITILV